MPPKPRRDSRYGENHESADDFDFHGRNLDEPLGRTDNKHG